jgi:hypothetical protein
MRIAGIRIVRRSWRSSACWDIRLITLIPNPHPIILYHELGHFLSLPLETVKKMWNDTMYANNKCSLSMLQVEAAAWRWAVKMWTERHGKLGKSEIDFIKESFGSYIKARED